MNMKEHLLDLYKYKELIYPIEGNEKFVFESAFEAIKEKEPNKVLSVVSEGEYSAKEIYKKLTENTDVGLFSYYYEKYQDNPMKHHIKIYFEDETLLIASQLVNNQDKILELLVK